MTDLSATAQLVASRYVASLHCMWSVLAGLPLEKQLPTIASVVLHGVVPLLYVQFEEARSVLGWALMSYAIMHALFHFGHVPLKEAMIVAHLCTLAPMIFVLWISAGQQLEASACLRLRLAWSLTLLHVRLFVVLRC